MLNQKIEKWQKVLLASRLLNKAIHDYLETFSARDYQRMDKIREKYWALKDEWANKEKGISDGK